MKKVIIFVNVILLIILLCSCSANKTGNEVLLPENSSSAEKTESQSNDIGPQLGEVDNIAPLFPLKTYSILEISYPYVADDPFDEAMINNPIDSKRLPQIKDILSASTQQQQIFFDEYSKEWIDELDFAIDNLKKYLTEGEIEQLNKSQENWKATIDNDNMLENAVLGNHEINMGTQVVFSKMVNNIEKYRERTFYIKYLTMLIEEYKIDSVPEEELLWCKWK